jgi:hypothetical protein
VTRLIMVAIAAGISLLVASCGSSDGGPEPGGGSGGSTSDGSVAGDAAEGPFECLKEGNIARRKSDGDTEPCGLERCTAQNGCGVPGALGCETDDDCVSSTLEAGWQVDYPVKCIAGGCGPVTPPPGH